MIVENGIIKISTKGQDVVMSALQKIEKAKTNVGKALSVGIKYLTEKGGAAKSDELARMREREESRMTRGLKDAANNLHGFSRGLASMEGGAAISAGFGAMGNAGQSIGGKAGGVMSAVAMLGDTVLSGAQAISQKLQDAIPKAIETQTMRKRAEFYMPGREKAFSRFTWAETSQAINSIASQFGKIETGSNYQKSINKIMDANKDYAQSIAIATGNFSALGTNKGFFMQQIANSLGSLPPSAAQEIQSQLMSNIDYQSELADDANTGIRNAAVKFDEISRAQAENISSIKGIGKTAADVEKALNDVALNLLKGGVTIKESSEKVAKVLSSHADAFAQIMGGNYKGTKGKQK